MDEESGSRSHLRSWSWSREHRGAIAGGACVLSYVLCSVWSLRTLLLKFTGWQNITLGFQSCHWVRLPLQKEILDSHPSWTSFWHCFCILCILLGELSGYHFFECESIRYQCIVESCNTGNISLSQQGFHSNRAEFIHLKRKPIWEKMLPSHIFKNTQFRWADHCLIDPFRWSMKLQRKYLLDT